MVGDKRWTVSDETLVISLGALRSQCVLYFEDPFIHYIEFQKFIKQTKPSVTHTNSPKNHFICGEWFVP